MTQRRTLLAVLAAIATFASAAAFGYPGTTSLTPSGKIAREARPAKGYSGVALALPGKVEIRQAADESVTVEADDNLLAEIETAVENGTLKIRFRRPLSLSGKVLVRIVVTGPAFESLAIQGSGDIQAGDLKASALSAAIEGSGDIAIARLTAGSAKVAVSGSGDFRAGGSADELSVSIAGSGDVHARGLEAGKVSVSIAGSGNATVWAKESLSVSIAGSGDVLYLGDPQVTKRVAGSGSVKRAKPVT